jgi:outer membrane protein
LQYNAKAQIEQSDKEVNEQIWKRINPVIDEFAKKNNFSIIIGGNGMGTVLYSNNAINVTTKLIEYANNKYENGN